MYTRILGIDPGSVITGVGVVDLGPQGPVHVHHHAIRAGNGDFPGRLKLIFEGLSALIQEFQPTHVAVEQVFVSRNPDSALKLGQARGAAICAAVAMNCPVAEYAPRAIKQALVGRGGADKRQLQHMVAILLRIGADLQADAADALGVAICHAHHLETARRLGTSRRTA